MSHLTKLFLKVIHNRIYKKCEATIEDTQFGFRNGFVLVPSSVSKFASKNVSMLTYTHRLREGFHSQGRSTHWYSSRDRISLKRDKNCGKKWIKQVTNVEVQRRMKKQEKMNWKRIFQTYNAK